jgi:type VI secretion system protein VasG
MDHRTIERDLRECVGRLTPAAQASLGAAVKVAMEHGHRLVEVEHWLLKVFDVPNEKIEGFLRTNEVDTRQLRQDLEAGIRACSSVAHGEDLSCGAHHRDTPALSDEMVEVLFRVANRGSSIPPEQLLFEILSDKTLSAQLGRLSPELGKIIPESLERLVT